MKQFLLATVLIAVPVGAFAEFHLYQGNPTPTTNTLRVASLGDLSSFRTIVTDALAIAARGDLAAAEERMTDFESAWDSAQSKLRVLNSASWGNIDDAHDVALKALRTGPPVPEKVSAALTALVAVLDDPVQTSDGTRASETTIAGVTITDGNGRVLPCEALLKTFRAEMATAKLSDTDKPKVDDFLAKGTERCNADDDKRAAGFFAQGLSLLRQ